MTDAEKYLKEIGEHFPMTVEDVAREEERQAAELAAMTPEQRAKYEAEVERVLAIARAMLMETFKNSRPKSFAE